MESHVTFHMFQNHMRLTCNDTNVMELKNVPDGFHHSRIT